MKAKCAVSLKNPHFQTHLNVFQKLPEFPRADGRTIGAPRRCKRFKKPKLAMFTHDFSSFSETYPDVVY
jgi:hypothetical protein